MSRLEGPAKTALTRPRRVKEEWPEALSTERNAGIVSGVESGPSRIVETWYQIQVAVLGLQTIPTGQDPQSQDCPR